MSDDLRRLSAAVAKLQESFLACATREQVKTEMSRVTASLDEFAGVVEAVRRERELFGASFETLRYALQEHEARLVRLEEGK